MSSPSSFEPRGSSRSAVVLGLVFVMLDVWLRWPGWVTPGFASHDVAGITYNGMLLGLGELPYVDSVELKAPLTFYVAALVQALAGGPGLESTSMFVMLANALATVCAALLTATTTRLWGWGSGALCAVLLLVFLPVLDSMDANYVTWANAFAMCALSCQLWALTPRWKGRLWPWLLAGVLAAACALSKRPVAAFVPASFLMAAVGADSARWLRRSSALVLGMCAMHVPFLAHYAASGHDADFVRGYLLNEWGGAYIGQRKPELGHALTEGVLASVHFLGLALMVGAFSISRALRDSRGPERGLVLALALWAASLGAAAFVGFRFYKGYFAPVLAPLAVLAAHPQGVVALLQSARSDAKARMLALALALMAGVFAYRQLAMLTVTRSDRARRHDNGGRRIAEFIAPQLRPGDRIWVWGWHLWDVYTYANAPSASRIYKSLGLLTPPNDDTWRGGGSPMRFVDGAFATLLLDDFAERGLPRFIVLGSTVPRASFDGLQTLLRTRYRRVRGPRIGRVQYWELRREQD